MKLDNLLEICMGLSNKYILPYTDKGINVPIGILDALNGYKFAFSYHLLEQDNNKVYWYFTGGCKRFLLNDIEWLWSRYFCKINGNIQYLSNEIKNNINIFKKNKKLSNLCFDEFKRQFNQFDDNKNDE